MPFDWDQFLQTAKLLQQGSEADKRTAVSRAYYAAFHAAKNFAVSKKYSSTGAGSDHSGVRRHLTAMKGHHVQKSVMLGRLYSYREQCDYEPDVQNLDEKVASAIADATTITATLSGFVTSFYGSGGNTLAFTAATGQMTGNSTADDSGLSVSNLALGVHTVKITFNNPSAANMRVNSFDVVTPIHSYKTNGPHVIQNTLAIGSQGINDGRSFGDQLKIPNMAVFCKGVASSFTTTSTGYVSIGDSMVNIKSTGNPVLVNYNLIVSQLTTLGDMQFTLYVDGNDIVPSTDQVTIDMQTLNKNISVNWSIMLYLSPGYHCIQLFAKTSTGSLNIPGNRRNISAVEITA